MLEPKKIIVCEDHAIMVDGLEMLLANHPHYSIVGHAQKEEEILHLLSEKNPEIVLLDLNLKNTDGFSILGSIRKTNADVKVLIFTMYDSEFLIEKARTLKANGYLLKNVGNDELLKALDALYDHSDFYVSDELKNRKKQNGQMRDDFVEKMRLTKREVEIIRLIAKGKQNEDIAEQLFLSFHTVKTHRKNILKKLTLNNTADLVRFAYESHLI